MPLLFMKQPLDALNNFGAIGFADGEADACFLRCKGEINGVFDGEQDHGQMRRGLGDLASGLQSILLRHGEVKHNDVGRERECLGDRIPTIDSFTANLPAGVLFENAAYESADGSIVVGDENAGRHRGIVECEGESGEKKSGYYPMSSVMPAGMKTGRVGRRVAGMAP